ncbi:carboxypeptidase-like regulatory domain-containing protein [Bacteroides sp. BFG-551]|nr:carboxypeptidase-like regulatory domain-containing protein [Bacteroides sp. BFG-551]
MKKIKYCAALFALSITMQPGIVLADPSGIANKVADAQVITQKNLQKTITGVVMDTNGESIIGATVLVKGTSRGTATDIDGRFTINAAEGDELEFRYVGYITVVEKVKKDTRTINIRMEADAVNLEDVVIVGYGQQKKESVVASMSTIGPAELHVSSRSLNNNIAGKISGVIAVQRSGEPGWDDAQFLDSWCKFLCRWYRSTRIGRRCTSFHE